MKKGSLAVKKRTVKKIVVKNATTKKPAKKTIKIATPKNNPKKSTVKPKSKSHQKTAPVNLQRENLKRDPLGHLLVGKMLREAGFSGGISTNADILTKYSTDESIFSIRPQVIIQPKHRRDVEIAVQVLKTEVKRFPTLSLTPRAAGTGLSGGSLTDSIVVDVTKHMCQIQDISTRKGLTTFTCEPGAMWKDVEKKLKKHKVYLPPYPASKDICTIGGAVANNSAGPDSLRFGHCADWVESLDVTLSDGKTYTIKPLTYREFKILIKKKNPYAQIAKEVFDIISKNEKAIQKAKPKTKKNSAGYPLWDVLNHPVASFKRGTGTFDLTRLISGSQGTIGVITSITMRTEPINNDTELIVIPVFDLLDIGKVVTKALEFNPINIEIFDAITFDLALKNPQFCSAHLGKIDCYKVLLAMYTTFHIRYARKTPNFTLLVTLDKSTLGTRTAKGVVKTLKQNHGKRARVVTNKPEKEMFWQIRRASYSLSKLQDVSKRPAAFLEDMTVPPENLSKFFVDVKKLLKKYSVTAAVHGHGGNGHLHFYPLLDFTSQVTPTLIEKMAEDFFTVAVKHNGNICGEHNDGIIRTPHLSKMFNKKTIDLFKQVEHLFDPLDIFNPGKKVNPRFDIKESLRKIN